MATMNDREKEIITKASDVLFSLSCRADKGMEERRLLKASEMLEAILENYE